MADRPVTQGDPSRLVFTHEFSGNTWRTNFEALRRRHMAERHNALGDGGSAWAPPGARREHDVQTAGPRRHQTCLRISRGRMADRPVTQGDPSRLVFTHEFSGNTWRTNFEALRRRHMAERHKALRRRHMAERHNASYAQQNG